MRKVSRPAAWQPEPLNPDLPFDEAAIVRKLLDQDKAIQSNAEALSRIADAVDDMAATMKTFQPMVTLIEDVSAVARVGRMMRNALVGLAAFIAACGVIWGTFSGFFKNILR